VHRIEDWVKGHLENSLQNRPVRLRKDVQISGDSPEVN